MRRLALGGAVAMLACAPLVASCDSDPSSASPTPSTSAVTSSTPSPTTPSTAPPTTTTPALPESAKSETVSGAKSFVRYFMRLINYTSHARVGAPLRRLSTPHCISCRGIADSNDKLREGGGFYHGGDLIVTSMTPVPLQARERPIIHTSLNVRSGVWKRTPRDHPRQIKSEKMYLDVHLIWIGDHWVVTGMLLA